MNKRQNDKINSYQTLKVTLEKPDNKPVWSALPAFGKGVAQFYGSMNILAALAKAQGEPVTGITDDKNRLADSVINRTLEIAGAAAAYASATENATLLAKVDFSKSVLKGLRDAELDDQAQAIHDTAAALVAKDAATMTDYGLTAAKLTDLQSSITAYSGMVGSPRSAISGKSAITVAIDAEFTRADEILNEQLDKLVVQFQTGNAQFVNAYWAARSIVDTGSHAAPAKPAPPAPAQPAVK